MQNNEHDQKPADEITDAPTPEVKQEAADEAKAPETDQAPAAEQAPATSEPPAETA